MGGPKHSAAGLIDIKLGLCFGACENSVSFTVTDGYLRGAIPFADEDVIRIRFISSFLNIFSDSLNPRGIHCHFATNRSLS